MKIAVASNNNGVSGHFGKCKNFNIFEVVNNEIVNVQSIENIRQGQGCAGAVLDSFNIDVVISGGIGVGAKRQLTNKNITVVTGASGNAKQAVKEYISGELQSDGLTCSNSNDNGSHRHKHKHKHKHRHGSSCCGH